MGAGNLGNNTDLVKVLNNLTRKRLNIIHWLYNKVIQMRCLVWLLCMIMEKVLQNQSKKLLNFIHKQPIKDMLVHNQFRFMYVNGEGVDQSMNLHVNGGSKQQFKIMRRLFNIFKIR